MPAQIAMRTAAYPAKVEVCVVTDQPLRLRQLMDFWQHAQ